MDACERFRLINLSDCRLLGFAVEPITRAELGNVHLDLRMIAGPHADEWTAARLRFHDCVWFATSIRFPEKHAGQDSIAAGSCASGEPMLASLLDGSPASVKARYDGFWLFTIDLITGGQLQILARDFTLADVHAPDAHAPQALEAG